MAFVNRFIGLTLSMQLTMTLQKLYVFIINKKGGKQKKTKERKGYIYTHTWDIG